MGLFRSTLRDAKALAQRGRWDEVIKIIDKHHNDELIIHKDLKSLKAAIDIYSKGIEELQIYLRQQPNRPKQILRWIAGPGPYLPPPTPRDKTVLLRAIADMESHLDWIEGCIKKLIKDKKLVLE